MRHKSQEFLPTTRADMRQRGWDSVDVVLVTGDAYIDHPSFGVSLIGRVLESHGYRVAVLAQPHYGGPDEFRRFGRPRLFFGITAGNLDSIVANYTGNGKVRDEDGFSPGGNPYFGDVRSKAEKRRPDRATILYANLARAAYGDVPIILGGLEASLRRFVHYDYQQSKLRTSVLTDAKADLLVYGMGERAIVEIAGRIEAGEALTGIAGTCERITDRELSSRTFEVLPMMIPSWEDIQKDTGKFIRAELDVDKSARALSRQPILQRQQSMWVLQNEPAAPLDSAELDHVYSLSFTRMPHPSAGDVPAYRMIRHSVTIVRGCFGNCSFCAIGRHQGPMVTCRSPESIIQEARRITGMPDFGGTISDLGGPTANLYGTSCGKAGLCSRHDCLYPGICRHLRIDEEALLNLLKAVASVPGVEHVFVSSGLRMELLLRTPRLLSRLLAHHTPGAMKIAPEHTEPEVLRLMHKCGHDVLGQFLEKCRAVAVEQRCGVRFTPYFISSHPGCTQEDMEALSKGIKRLGLVPRQFQDFTPTPGTISTAMFVTGLDRDSLKPIHVAQGGKERRLQRSVLENMRPKDKRRK